MANIYSSASHNSNMVTIPAVPLLHNAELNDTIIKLAVSVANNGPGFEEKVKNDQKNNPFFSFLKDPEAEGFLFYRWRLFCSQSQYSDQQIEIIESNHRKRLKEIILQDNMGCIDLTLEDQDILREKLKVNRGDKDDIQGLRKWIIKRSHSLKAIFLYILQYIQEISLLSTKSSSENFLYNIYVCLVVIY